MHAAPPVRVNLRRSWAWVVFCGLCTGAAATSLAAWLPLRGASAPSIAWLLGALAAAAAAWLAARESTAGDLDWDGVRWHWDGVEGDARVMLDLNTWMLLRFDPPTGRRRWIAASRRSSCGVWAALRAALYCLHPVDPLDLQQP